MNTELAIAAIGSDIRELKLSRIDVNSMEDVIESILFQETNLVRVREYIQEALGGQYVQVAKIMAEEQVDFQTAVERGIERAASMKRFLLLPEGDFELTRQIYIGAEHQGILGIRGAGMKKTRLTFNWPQTTQYDWDWNTNAKDVRPVQGILVENVSEVILRDFGIQYTGEFYRRGVTYFGSISCIALSDTHHCKTISIEASGANRIGIRFTSHSSEVKTENADFYNGRKTIDWLDNNTVRARGNSAFGCYTHHNRVAGIAFENQIDGQAVCNISEYNGHKDDGGTGYGIVAMSGTVNINLRFACNIVRYNYRKGLDSHDSVDLELTGNVIYGNRLFGIAIECRGYPARKHVITNNNITQDPNNIMTWTDNLAIGAAVNLNQYKDYWAYTGIRYEHTPQMQPWKDNITRPVVIIENNRIDGINQVTNVVRNGYVGIEVRQNENRESVYLDVTIKNNTIVAERINQAIYVVSNERCKQGFGDVDITGNNIDIGQIVYSPIDIEEKFVYTTAREENKRLNVSNNHLVTRQNNAALEKIAKLQTAANVVDFKDNIIDIYGNFGRPLIRVIDNKVNSTLTCTGNRFTSQAHPNAFWVSNTGTDYLNKDHAKATKFIRGNNTYGRHLAIADTQDDTMVIN